MNLATLINRIRKTATKEQLDAPITDIYATEDGVLVELKHDRGAGDLFIQAPEILEEGNRF